jgi:hypothetical protein
VFGNIFYDPAGPAIRIRFPDLRLRAKKKIPVNFSDVKLKKMIFVLEDFLEDGF